MRLGAIRVRSGQMWQYKETGDKFIIEGVECTPIISYTKIDGEPYKITSQDTKLGDDIIVGAYDKSDNVLKFSCLLFVDWIDLCSTNRKVIYVDWTFPHKYRLVDDSGYNDLLENS